MKGSLKFSPGHQNVQLRRRSEKIKIDVNYISEDPQNKENHHRILNDLLIKEKQKKHSSEKLALSTSKKNIKIVNKSSVMSKQSSIEKRSYSKENQSQSKNNQKECFKKKKNDDSVVGLQIQMQVKQLLSKLSSLSSKIRQKSFKNMQSFERVRTDESRLFQEFKAKLKPTQMLSNLFKSMQEYISQIWKKFMESRSQWQQILISSTMKNEQKRKGPSKDLDCSALMSATAYFGQDKWRGTDSLKSKLQDASSKNSTGDNIALNQSIIVSQSGSQCTYLADPSIQVSVKWLRADLKEKLQLNLSNLDSIRKREMPS